MKLIMALTLIVVVTHTVHADNYRVDVQRYDNRGLHASRYDIKIINQVPPNRRLGIVDYMMREPTSRPMTGGEAAMQALNNLPYQRLLEAQTALLRQQLYQNQWAAHDATWLWRQRLLDRY